MGRFGSAEAPFLCLEAAMVANIFIDGEAGTTGLQIRQRLEGRRDVQLVAIDPELRKDAAARRDYLNAADLVILCLPDEAARDAVALIENPRTRIIDASTAHRTASGWTFGFPEMAADQRRAIAGALRVSNPGCWSTGFIAMVKPLVDQGLIPEDWPMTVGGISGYSGGGKSMIAEFEDETAPNHTTAPFRLYALGMGHKHLPEMQRYSGLARRPVFSPAVGRYYKGMIVEAPLFLHALPRAPRLSDVRAVLADTYRGEQFVEVATASQTEAMTSVGPESLNGTNSMRLHVFGSDEIGQARLVAVFDNLGKGASGAAVQNLNLMLGLAEGAGV
jgi:N-acetyl-gamma-glutamyl-phosphate reductase